MRVLEWGAIAFSDIYIYKTFSVEKLYIYICKTSLVAQTVKRLPTVWETHIQSLGREDLLEKAMATHYSILTWKISWMEELGKLQSWGHKESDTTEQLHFTSYIYKYLVSEI